MVPKKTAVCWDVDSCPIPGGYDPSCVRPSIESALNKSFGSDFGVDDEVTIFATGNLMHITRGDHIALSSSGILLRHTNFGLKRFCDELFVWQRKNPPPATLMLISNNPCADKSYHHYLLNGFVEEQYTVIPAYPRDCGDSWRWETILKEAPPVLKTPSSSHFVLEDNCACWICLNCDFASHNQIFAQHLYSVNHDQRLYEVTHVPLKEVEIYQEFLKDKNKVTLMLDHLEQVCLPSDFPEKDEKYGLEIIEEEEGEEPGTSLFVGNLPMDATSDQLFQLFGSFGLIKHAQVKRTSEAMGVCFAFVVFESTCSVHDVLLSNRPFTLGGRDLCMKDLQTAFA